MMVFAGFTLSADGEYAYFTPIASRDLYRVPTELLRVNPKHDRSAVIKAASAVQYLGEARFFRLCLWSTAKHRIGRRRG